MQDRHRVQLGPRGGPRLFRVSPSSQPDDTLFSNLAKTHFNVSVSWKHPKSPKKPPSGGVIVIFKIKNPKPKPTATSPKHWQPELGCIWVILYAYGSSCDDAYGSFYKRIADVKVLILLFGAFWSHPAPSALPGGKSRDLPVGSAIGCEY